MLLCYACAAILLCARMMFLCLCRCEVLATADVVLLLLLWRCRRRRSCDQLPRRLAFESTIAVLLDYIFVCHAVSVTVVGILIRYVHILVVCCLRYLPL